MAEYARGQRIHMSLEVRDSSGVLADPTEVNWRAKPPGTASVISALYSLSQVARDATGLFHYDYTIADTAASEGRWTYRWITTGPIVAGTGDQSFNVQSTLVSS